MKEYLKKVSGDFGIPVSEEQLEKFRLFYEHLIKVNQVMNLTAITEEKEVVVKHFLDSISVMRYIPFTGEDVSQASMIQKVIDVGTGAGFPGIPLAIMYPDISFTLMDSLNKRILFLEEAAKICGLKNIRTVHSRAEELGQDPSYREQYDICVSRAVANLSVLLEYCVPLVRKGGTFIPYKSIGVEEELTESKNAQNKLCCKCKNQFSFQLGENGYSRTLLLFEKFDSTSKKYPRGNGVPKKKPL